MLLYFSLVFAVIYVGNMFLLDLFCNPICLEEKIKEQNIPSHFFSMAALKGNRFTFPVGSGYSSCLDSYLDSRSSL